MPLSVLRGERSPGQVWTDHDSLMAQALEFYESSLCPGCGHPVWDSLDPATDGKWFSPLPSRCFGCTAISERSEGYAESPQPHALKFRAVLAGRDGG